jgi:hypothetical protein
MFIKRTIPRPLNVLTGKRGCGVPGATATFDGGSIVPQGIGDAPACGVGPAFAPSRARCAHDADSIKANANVIIFIRLQFQISNFES